MPAYEPEKENQERKNLTVSINGKSVCSTGKMKKYQGNALHIVSPQFAEHGLAFAQQTVKSKSNEIPAVRALLKELDIRGCLVTADATRRQTNTAEIILEGKGDYLLSAKDNHDQMREATGRHIKDDRKTDAKEQLRDIQRAHSTRFRFNS